MNRNQFLLTLCCATALSLSAYTPATRPDDDNPTPYQTKTFTGNLTMLRAETSGGSLSVEGGSGNTVKVEMYVRPNNWNGMGSNLSKEEIENRLKDYDVSITQEGNTVVATAKRTVNNNDWKHALSISFKVYTPKNFGTSLRTSGGSIRLSHLTGKQDFRTSGGSMNIADVTGDVSGRTSGGSIHVADCNNSASGQINLETSGGSIEALNSSGKLTLETSGGSVRMRDLNGMINAHTSGGSVSGEKIEGELIAGTSGGSVRLRGISGSIEAETSAGGMEIEIERVGKYVRLSNSGGSVRVRMPLDKGLDLDLRGNRVSTTGLTHFDGDIEKDRVRGRLNGGGIPVTISSSSGNVSLNN